MWCRNTTCQVARTDLYMEHQKRMDCNGWMQLPGLRFHIVTTHLAIMSRRQVATCGSALQATRRIEYKQQAPSPGTLNMFFPSVRRFIGLLCSHGKRCTTRSSQTHQSETNTSNTNTYRLHTLTHLRLFVGDAYPLISRKSALVTHK